MTQFESMSLGFAPGVEEVRKGEAGFKDGQDQDEDEVEEEGGGDVVVVAAQELLPVTQLKEADFFAQPARQAFPFLFNFKAGGASSSFSFLFFLCC